MTFQIPEDLAPEVYPLAWLVGTWQGEGTLGYGDHIAASAMRQRVQFTHDGGPYLAYTSTVWLLDGDGAQTQLWHTESGYWRIPPTADAAQLEAAGPLNAEGAGALPPDADPGQATHDGAPAPAGGDGAPPDGGARQGPPAATSTPAGAGSPAPSAAPSFPVEVLMAEPAGFVAVYIGQTAPGRIDMATDILARTESAARVDAARRMYGLVESDLLWVWDIAAFGQPMGSYMAARLSRVVPQADGA